MGLITSVLITQPIVTLTYNIGRNFFQTFSNEYYVLMKLIFLAVTIIISIAIFSIYSISDKKRLNKLKNKNMKEVEIVLKMPEDVMNNNIKHMKNYTRDMIITVIIVFSLPIYLYLTTSNGTEAGMLVIVSILIFGLLISNRYALQTSYLDFQFIFKEKE